jgi:uncharacterized protein (TIGR03067 family)
VDKALPPRPNVDHLRRQAKALLASLKAGDGDAVKTIRQHLPAAEGLSDQQIRQAGFRLADAQSAVARKSGFASWPQLARHVDQLRALEGTWEFVRLEIEGAMVSPEGFRSSRMLIDGDRFRMESPEANYEGMFNIDVEAEPHHIDIEFVEGPEAGNWNYGIFRMDGEQLEICLDMTGKGRPAAFRTSAGTGHACELLRRTSGARPEAVTGGNPQAAKVYATFPCPEPATPAPDGPPVVPAGFEYVASETLCRLQGEWLAEKLVRDGQELPGPALQTGRRVTTGNEVKMYFGGRLLIHILMRLNETVQPIRVDYFNLAGPTAGATQLGIMEWSGGQIRFCTSAPGNPRPTGFESPAGSGASLSCWRKA